MKLQRNRKIFKKEDYKRPLQLDRRVAKLYSWKRWEHLDQVTTVLTKIIVFLFLEDSSVSFLPNVPAAGCNKILPSKLLFLFERVSSKDGCVRGKAVGLLGEPCSN